MYQFEVKTKDGTLVVEVDGDVDARFKNGELLIFDPAGNLKYTLRPGERDARLPAGPYVVRVRGADGVALDTPEFTMTRDGRVTVRVTAKAVTAKAATTPAPAAVSAEDAATDLKAAEWVLSIGGTVRVNGENRAIQAAADLPKKPFRLTWVQRNGQVADAGLAALAGCTKLSVLDLNATPVGDAGLAHLKGLTGLTELHLGGTRVTDAGLVHLKGLTGLTYLTLSPKVGGAGPRTRASLTSPG